MPRGPRISFENGFFHIYNRGVAKQKIFIDDVDYTKFLFYLSRLKTIKGFDHSVYAYCLMSNHFHFLIQTRKTPIAKILSSLATSYSMYFNHKYERVGPLFQNRFKSKLCDCDTYFLGASRYIHLNPIEAGLVTKLSDYPWSSFQEIYGSSRFSIIDKADLDGLIGKKEDYLKFLEDGIIILEDLKEVYNFSKEVGGNSRFTSLALKKYRRRHQIENV